MTEPTGGAGTPLARARAKEAAFTHDTTSNQGKKKMKLSIATLVVASVGTLYAMAAYAKVA